MTRGASLRYWFCCRSRGPVCTAVRKCPLSASSTPPEVWSYPVPRHQEREGSEAKLTASLLTLGCSPVHTRRRHTATTTPAPSYSSAPSPPLHAVSSAHTPPRPCAVLWSPGWPHTLTWQVPMSLHFWGVGLAWRPGLLSRALRSGPAQLHLPSPQTLGGSSGDSDDWEPTPTQTSTELLLLGLPQPSQAAADIRGVPQPEECVLAHSLALSVKQTSKKPLCLGSLKPGFHTIL